MQVLTRTNKVTNLVATCSGSLVPHPQRGSIRSSHPCPSQQPEAPQAQHVRRNHRVVRVQAASPPLPTPFARSTMDEPIVDEIMQPHPITVRPEMSCKDAARVLLNNDLSSVPVVDDKGKLVGVLSESDLLWKGAGAPLDHTIIPPVFVGAFDLLISLKDSSAVKSEIDKILARTVGQAMSKHPITATPGTTLSEAAKELLAHKVHLLPVVNEQGLVVGVLTQHDILRGMVAQQLPLLE